MHEWILVVWLVVIGDGGPVLAPAFEVGTYYKLDRCEEAAASIEFESQDVNFIVVCVERDK